MQDEKGIVERAKRNDPEAFAYLYETYFDRIYRYLVFKIGNEMEAEDMTQQVFLKALRSITSFRWKGVSFSSWLFRIAHNQAVDYFRRKNKRISVSLNESIVAGSDNPQRQAELHDDIEQLVSAAQNLTLAQREVISLRFAGGLSVAEAARAMGRSEGAVKALQHSAIVALRKVLVLSG